MPWHMVANSSACPTSKPYAVVLNADGSLVGCHSTKAKANKQLAALYANEGDSMSSADQATEEQLDQRPPRDGLVRAAADKADITENGAGPVLHGHFARFDEWTEIDSMREGNFMERIAPGAFAKTLSESDGIKVTFQHGHDPSLGDQALGSIRSMQEDDIGAAYEVELFDGVPPLLMSGLRAGEYGSSFRFRVVKEDFNRKPDKTDSNPEGIPERTIKEAQVYEFGPVTYPAYAGATAQVRSLTDEYQEVNEAKHDPERWLELHETVLRALGDKPADEVIVDELHRHDEVTETAEERATVVANHPSCPTELPYGVMNTDDNMMACHATQASADTHANAMRSADLTATEATTAEQAEETHSPAPTPIYGAERKPVPLYGQRKEPAKSWQL